MMTQQFIHIKCLLRKSENLETENTSMQILDLLYQFSPMCRSVNVCSDAFVFLLRKH